MTMNVNIFETRHLVVRLFSFAVTIIHTVYYTPIIRL